MSELDPMLQDDVEARISDWRLDVDDRWDTFVRLVQDDELSIEIDDFYPRREFVERVECLIRGMGDDERPVRWVMETLPRTINEEDYSSARELIAVSLSGVLRLKEAIPYSDRNAARRGSRNGRARRSFPVKNRRGGRHRGPRPVVCRRRTVFSVAGRDGPSIHRVGPQHSHTPEVVEGRGGRIGTVSCPTSSARAVRDIGNRPRRASG